MEELKNEEIEIIEQFIVPAIIAFQEQSVAKSVKHKNIREYIEKECKKNNIDINKAMNYIVEAYNNRKEKAQKDRI